MDPMGIYLLITSNLDLTPPPNEGLGLDSLLTCNNLGGDEPASRLCLFVTYLELKTSQMAVAFCQHQWITTYWMDK